MRAALDHRGPDGAGIYADPDLPIYLGHTRLAIVDINDGVQPMQSQDGSVVVVYNGEIYNHLDLRKELEAKGCIFRTDHSDTEVLIHGWRIWGVELPGKLNGMFAFAILDRRAQSIFLARDRFGEKPLYWMRQGDFFAFASELSAFSGHPQFVASYDRQVLKKYFAHGFIPAPNTILQNTRKIPGGGWLRFNAINGDIGEGRYWRYHVEPQETGRSDDELADDLRERVSRATKRRLMSDVPIGVFLSGGLDSSIVAACAVPYAPANQISTFSLGFKNPHFDESSYARAMAKHLGTCHKECILDMESARSLIWEILAKLDEPLADPSLLPTYLLSQFTREHVTVALSGDGSDELFCGYDTFAALRPAQIYHALVPGSLHRLFKNLSHCLPQSKKNMSLDFKLRRVFKGLNNGPELWNPTWLAPLEIGELNELFQETVQEEEIYSEVLDLWHSAPQLGLNERTQEFYVNFYLQDGILAKVDRAAMMNGLETRAVFLDPDVVELARTLPTRLKISGGDRKHLLKKAFAPQLPADILRRPKKGFGVPLIAWFSDLDISDKPASQQNLDVAVLHRFMQEHRTGKSDYRLFLWAWTVLAAKNAAAAH